VDDNLFKAPKRYFESNSGIFAGILALPSEGNDADGSSDEKPIRLNAIEKVDFERLLEAMYPTGGRRPATMGRNEWESVLKLSTVWGMGDIRNMVIGTLTESLDSADKILLGQKYGVPNWLLVGCTELAEREETISGAEGRVIGPDIVAGLCQVREASIKAGFQKYNKSLRRATTRYDYEDHIRTLFVRELADAEKIMADTWPHSPCIGGCASAKAMPKPARNQKFYMESVVFLVEDNLFKVPRACFEHTGIFRTIFTLPTIDDTPVDGSDDEHPFKLDGIKKADFQVFLKVLYPRDIPLQRTTVTEEEWTVVLELPTMWDFFEVRKLAIEELSKLVMSPITKILLARRYNIQKWLFAGYEELAKRTEPVSVGEAEQLGWDTAILIFQVREESLVDIVAGWGEKTDCDAGVDRTDCNCAEGIWRVFAKELKDVEEQQVVVAVPE